MKTFTILLATVLVTLSPENKKGESNPDYFTCGYCSKEKTVDNPYGELQQYKNCAYIDSNGELKFVNEHFKNVNFGNDSIASIYISGFGFAYIHKNGKIAVMHTYDNGPDYFVEGLARTIQNGKIGFVNRSLKIVIEPEYDAAYPFLDGVAKVGINCKSIKDGEHSYWQCNKWFYIDTYGEIVKK